MNTLKFVVEGKTYYTTKFSLSKKEQQLCKKPEEKRAAQREPYFQQVSYKCGNHIHCDCLRDISQKGIFINTNAQFDAGQEIDITLTLPESGEPIELKGEIVRTTPEGIGVKFKKEIC